MAHESTKTIKVTEESNLAKLLTEAAVRPILLENNDEVFLLERMDQEGQTLSPEDVTRPQEGIRKAAGSWQGIDTDTFKAYIKDRRQTANRLSVKL